MIGDPSGKSQERNLLDEATLRHNQEAIKAQLAKLIDFDSTADNHAILVNNYDWMKEFSFLDFAREIGKCITVNYMMAKDSVKKRFNGEGDGMSFTEFTYQLLQGYDFLHLYQTMNCKVQLGGADQWGNITTGTELIRRKLGSEAEAFAITCPLITKADGTKFGKTESGNVWLDAKYTSPYKFYQFWLNVSDDDAKRYIKIFTLLDRETVESLIAEHEAAPHLRVLQKRLAQEVTTMIHSAEEYRKAAEAAALASAKYYALTRLAQYAENKELDEAGVAELEAIVEKAIEAINAAETPAEVEQILAAALEAPSEHPLASAIVEEATGRKLEQLRVKDFEAIHGRGVRAVLGGVTFFGGNRAMMEENDIDLGDFAEKADGLAAQGKTALYFAHEKAVLGLVAVIFVTVKLGPVINGSMTVITMVFGVFMDCLELLVAFIQAYVFTMLSAVFIGMSRQEEH